MWQCSQQHENRDEARFCGKCGEKRDTQPRCSACRAALEPDDEFCTSCGHRRESAAPTAPPPPAPVPAHTPSPAPIAAAPAPEPPPPITEPEPVTFSFGGATIEMKDPSKPEKVAPPSARSGMNPMVTTVLSFVVIAAILYGAYYLVTR